MSQKQLLFLVSALLAACNTERVPAEDAGSTTALSSGSQTDATGETGETGGGPSEGLCGGWSLWPSLTGAEQPINACDEVYSFTGSLVTTLDPQRWQLDSCGCDEDCSDADPYMLQLTFYGEGVPQVPDMPACPQIDIYRDAACNVTGIVVRDLASGNAPVWWASTLDHFIPGFTWLSNQIFGDELCSDGDDDGPVVTGHAVRYGYDGSAFVQLLPAESGVLEQSPLGPIRIENGNASSSVGDDLDVYPTYIVIPQ